MATNQLQRYKAIGVAAIGAVVVVAAWKLRASSSGEAGAFADASGIVIPAQEAAEEGLRLRARVEPRRGGRTVRLEIGSGAATLELEDAKESATEDSVPMAFGRGTLMAPDRKRGHAFVEAVARFLDSAAPPRRANPTPLEPVGSAT